MANPMVEVCRQSYAFESTEAVSKTMIDCNSGGKAGDLCLDVQDNQVGFYSFMDDIYWKPESAPHTCFWTSY